MTSTIAAPGSSRAFVSGVSPAPRALPSVAPLLAPRSIAVIGASRTPRTMGHQVLDNLLRRGFTGAVYPVNPNAISVCSVRAYPSIGQVPDDVDLAVIAVPRALVCDVAEQCGTAGVRGLVVITAGFRELSADGADEERRLLDIVRRHGMRMVGPNCMGVVNNAPDVAMNATFAPLMPPFGHAAFVSQSGALGVSVLDYAREYGIGISQFVSVGNKADVSGNDLLEYWEHDPTVKVILMYVENFGNPAKFLRIASRITQSKPIVVVKAGRTRAGARAARSHTGALAASDVAVDALLTQAGVLRAGTIEELFDIALAFEVPTLPRSRRTAVVTNAGGPGILAADALDAAGLVLPPVSPPAVAAIETLLPAGVPVGNPLDLIASATPAGYRTALTALLEDPAIDCVVPIFIPPLGVDTEAVANAICDASRACGDKPVLAVLMGREGLREWRVELHAAGIPTYIFPESAARAVAALNRHREQLGRARTPAPPREVDRWTVETIVAHARAAGRTALTDVESLAVLEAYGIATTTSRFAATADEAARVARDIGFPVAIKAVSRDLPHKSDAGGVVLDVADADAVGAACARIRAEVARRAPSATVTGVSVSAMVHGGRETIVGFARDPLFGPLLLFGLGGVNVEALHDVAFRIGPLAERDAAEMIAGIRGTAILDGVRGQPPVDRAAIADALLRLSQLAADFPEITELDVNPLLAFEHRVVAVDCRVALVAAAESSPSPAGEGKEELWHSFA